MPNSPGFDETIMVFMDKTRITSCNLSAKSFVRSFVDELSSETDL